MTRAYFALLCLLASSMPLAAQAGHSLQPTAQPFPYHLAKPMSLPVVGPESHKAPGKARRRPAPDVGLGGAQFSSSRVIPAFAGAVYPYSAVGKLFTLWPDGSVTTCSGAVIGPRIVLTAGHCVDRGTGDIDGLAIRLIFAPGYHAGASIGLWEASFYLPTFDWHTGGGAFPNAADYAVVELEDNELGRVGNITGWLGFLLDNLNPNHVTMLGFPVAFDGGEWLHVVTAQSFANGPNNTVFYGSDMADGSDGGPWIQNFGEPALGQQGGLNPAFNRVVGVTSYRYVEPEGVSLAASSALDQRLLQIYELICARQDRNCQ